MSDNPYAELDEMFGNAREALMLPENEIEAIVRAFHECRLGLRYLPDADLDADDEVSVCLTSLKELMDTQGLEDPSGQGLSFVRASMLTREEKAELATLVNMLASTFEIKSHRWDEQ